MAINKNFVIKNGLEVNTNVLVAASDEQQVGVGTTRPYYKLHVGGGEGNRGGIGATDLTITGIATIGVANSSAGALNVVGVSTFDGDIDLTGSAGVSTVLWDASENRLEFKDNASVGFGTGNDLTLYHDGTSSFIKDTVGDLRISGDKITLELEDGTDVKVIDQFGVNITGVTTTNRLLVSGISTFTGAIDANSTSDFGGTVTVSSGNVVVSSGNVTLGTGVTVTNAGNIAAAGIITANGGVKVGAAFTVDANTGNVAVSGILTVGGNLQVTGDITYDEVTGRNLNITGITTLADQVNFGTSGAASTIAKNGNATFSGIVTATRFYAANGGGAGGRFIGIHTSADGGGIGIGSTTAHVGYGITYIDFKGPGVSTVYSSSVTGITTIYFQGGGSGSSVGAAGTWQNDGSQGISTAKSVGINTVGMAVTALQGGEKGGSSGIGVTFQGLYISNGMVVNDNQLNGNHYIGTAFGGVMAGPVTVNGIITVDGNWAVV